MGQAKMKREKEKERRRAERERQRQLRPHEYRPIVMHVKDPEQPDQLLGIFELHVDGKVYRVLTRPQKGGRHVDTGQRRRVKDQRTLTAVLARYDELHPGPVAEAATA